MSSNQANRAHIVDCATTALSATKLVGVTARGWLSIHVLQTPVDFQIHTFKIWSAFAFILTTLLERTAALLYHQMTMTIIECHRI